jgi:integrase
MPTLKMTDQAVQRVAVAPGERVDYFDAHPRDRQRGLVLRVSASAEGKTSRSWAVLYRIKGNTKLRRVTIGEYPSYSLAQARDEASQIVQAARRGIDVTREREAAARAQASKERDTIDAAAKSFLEDWRRKPKRKGGKRAEGYVDHLQQFFDNRILPKWRGRHIGEIRRTDVDDLVTEIAKETPILANRCLAAIKAMFNWAIRKEMIDANPAALVERPGVEQARERVLTAEELRWIWPGFETLNYPFGPFFKLALLTGQRRDEVGGMEWREIDEEKSVWTIPAARTKPGRVHVVPLSPDALAVIQGLKSTQRKEVPFVFSVTGKTSISGYSRAKTLLDKAITKSRSENKDEEGKARALSPLDRWTIHDLRRTMATECSQLGAARFVVARLLNHADSEVTGIYDRNSYLAEKTAAMKLWDSYLMSVVNPQPAKVASLAARRRAKASARG